jgi:hypothetical protein
VSGLTDKDCDAALEFLEGTCENIADAKAELERSEIMRKRIRKKHFLTAEGNNAEREAYVEGVAEVHQADDRYIDAVAAYEGLRAKRELRCIQVEVWRSAEASRRQVRP